MEEKRNLEINFKQAQEMFEGDNEILKKLAIEVFPELKPQPITDRVKTYEDALEVLGRKHFDENNLFPREIARRKLEIIIEALNEGWKPNLNNNQEYKWYCYFNWSSAGLGFSSSFISPATAAAYFGIRLILKNKKLANYIGQEFKYLYKEILLG